MHSVARPLRRCVECGHMGKTILTGTCGIDRSATCLDQLRSDVGEVLACEHDRKINGRWIDSHLPVDELRQSGHRIHVSWSDTRILADDVRSQLSQRAQHLCVIKTSRANQPQFPSNPNSIVRLARTFRRLPRASGLGARRRDGAGWWRLTEGRGTTRPTLSGVSRQSADGHQHQRHGYAATTS
jgi:hypothetical protein